MSPVGTITIQGLTGLPEITQGVDLGALIGHALDEAGVELQDGDVLVVSSKIVSKSLGLREHGDREAAVLRQSRRVHAERRTPAGTTRVVESLAGPVMAAAGIDASNTGPRGGMLLLPPDPDLAARQVYAGLLAAWAPAPLPRIGVLVTDTAGRPWRDGQVDFALGACGVSVLEDLRGEVDADGRALEVTSRAVADELAAAADLVKGKSWAIPVALVRGLGMETVGDVGQQGARRLVRTGADDWFRLGAAEAVRAALGAPPGSAAVDMVGIPSAAPESLHDRVYRAVRLAMLGQPEGTAVHVEGLPGPGSPSSPAGAVRLVVAAANDEATDGSCAFAVGRLTARLEVALHSEQLQGSVTVVPATAG